MAELDGLRIYALADEQSSYSPDIYFAVDDSTFTNTKKVKMSVIYPLTNTLSAAGNFNPVTSVLRLNDGGGTETKVTVQNFFQDTDVIDIIKLLGNTGWKTYANADITKDSAKVDANNFIANAISTLGIVCLTGAIDLTSQPSVGETLFTLPSSIPTASEDIYFPACDDSGNDVGGISGTSDRCYELYIPSGTRTIKAYNNNTWDRQAVFNVTYIGI